MSTLTLVRHGQASFFADDYDRLSELGQSQSRLLGRFWARQKTVIDETYTGPRSRQSQSAELAGAEFLAAGLDWPAPAVLPGLDEFDLDGLVRRLAPQLYAQNADFAALVRAYKASTGEHENLRSFQRMFDALVRHWQTLDTTDHGIETWSAFRQRVAGVIRRLQEQTPRGRRVVMFTSGGFIGAAIQHALNLPNDTTLELNWRIRNASLTEFVFTADRFTIDTSNTVPHLDDPTLWTYR
jgi:broad specificity phosphatase PhoE